MEKYFLNKDVLYDVCFFQNTLKGPIKSFVDAKIKNNAVNSFAKKVIRDLLIKQPELENLYNSFVTQIKSKSNNGYTTVYPNSLFAEMFDGKIEINNFSKQLLTTDEYFDDKLKRQNRLKYLLDEYPHFIQLVHTFIKEGRTSQNSALSNDSLLFDFYFNMLKSKNAVKNKLDFEEILSNIDFFNAPSEIAINKKKINTYILHFPKDLKLYNHIMGSMEDLIKNNATLKKLWEEKITLFPIDVQQEYYKQNITIKPWDDELSYHYRFQINEEYIIEQSKAASSKAERFSRVFHNVLGTIILNNFNPIEEGKKNVSSVSFLFSNEVDRERARKFCNNVAENILSIIKNANYELQYQEQYDAVNLNLQKMYMAFTLNEELNQTSSHKKNSIKNKL
jgi:hypothetical protein